MYWGVNTMPFSKTSLSSINTYFTRNIKRNKYILNVFLKENDIQIECTVMLYMLAVVINNTHIFLRCNNTRRCTISNRLFDIIIKFFGLPK